MNKQYLEGYLYGIIQTIEQPITVPKEADQNAYISGVLEARMAEVLRSLKKLRSVNNVSINNG